MSAVTVLGSRESPPRPLLSSCVWTSNKLTQIRLTGEKQIFIHAQEVLMEIGAKKWPKQAAS